jgi:hypothetical protein
MKQRQVEWRDAGDGWLSVLDPDVPLEVAIRPELVDDRLVIGSLYLSADEGVRTGTLKSLRLDRYEAALNLEGVRFLAEAVMRGDAVTQIVRRAIVTHEAFDLEPPDLPGGRYPDSFYEEVAAFYMAMLEGGYSPAPELARATGRPLSTVRRWVAECRRREILPKGRKGKAG